MAGAIGRLPKCHSSFPHQRLFRLARLACIRRQERKSPRLSRWKRSVPPPLDQQFHPRRQNFPGYNRFVAPRVISASLVPLPPSGLVLRYHSDSAAAERRRCHPESDRILREARVLPHLVIPRRLPSSRPIHLPRSDIADRERCLPARHGFVASTRARGNVPRALRCAIPALYRATKVRLESSVANRVALPP